MAYYYAEQSLIESATHPARKRAAEEQGRSPAVDNLKTTEPKTPPPLSDAQVALNLQDRSWYAVDVVFVKSPADAAEAVRTGQRYTYKTSQLSAAYTGAFGRLAHVEVSGTLRAVVIVEVRKPAARDILRAHRWLVYTDLESYQAEVAKDAEILAQIEAKIQATREAAELGKTVERLKADGVVTP